MVVSSPDSGLVFPDTGLEGAIRDHISKPTGPIYVSDVDTITYLYAYSRGISNLDSIQYLIALDTLYLYSNQIIDISPLSGFTSLSWLTLGVNQITDISPLAGLTSMVRLDLRSNQITDLSPYLTDYAKTAAAIDLLDLVITVDTSVAHLAGAMGKPVWVLLSYAPSFRWLLDRSDCPWYPTMRLFRQTDYGDWGSVFEQVRLTGGFYYVAP